MLPCVAHAIWEKYYPYCTKTEEGEAKNLSACSVNKAGSRKLLWWETIQLEN